MTALIKSDVLLEVLVFLSDYKGNVMTLLVLWQVFISTNILLHSITSH